MSDIFTLKNAEQIRLEQTEQIQKQIKQFYEDLYKDVSKQIKTKGGKSLSKAQLILLQRDIKKRISEINNDIENKITDSMITTSNEVVKNTRSILSQMGFKNKDIERAFYYVPDNVVRNIVTGNVYQNGWTLSRAIWGHSKQTQDTIIKIVGNGTAQGKGAYDIAKDIEKYVKPTASKESRTISSWRRAKQLDVEAGRAKEIGEKIKDSYYPGRVDYNAMRLSRTMITHAYQQSMEATNKNNPFVIGYRWLTSDFHGRVCNLCLDRATKDSYGLGPGVFPKDDLPLDHPNGMCTFEVVMSDDLSGISDMIDKWYKEPIGTYPDIDKYASDFIF
jgi:hypothetical protein